MAETGGIRAGGAFVEISTRTAGFMRGLTAAAARLKAWGAAITDIGKRLALTGIAAGGLLAGALKVFADQGDQLVNMSDRTGLAVETLAELGYAAKQTGADFSELEKGVRFLQKSGGKGSLKEILAFANELAVIEDPGERAARSMEIFGKAGTALLPMLKDGAAGLQEYMQRARDLGIVPTGAAARAADDFGDSLGDLWLQIKAVAFNIGAALAPELSDLIQWFQRSIKGVIDWVKANRDLIVGVAKIVVGVTLAGVVLVGIGLALQAAAIGMGILAGAVIVLGGVFAAVKAAILFLLTPVGAIGVALVALGAVVATQTGIIGDAIDWLKGVFNELAADAKVAFGGIADALSAGDITKAAAVLWAFLKLEWAKGTSALSNYWFAFKQGFIESWQETVKAFATIWIAGVGFIKLAWTNISEFISSITSGWLADTREGIIELQRLAGLLSDAEANQQASQITNANRQKQQKIKDDAERERRATIAGVQEQFTTLDQEAKAAQKARNAAMDKQLQDGVESVRAAQKDFKDAIDEAGAAKAAANAKVKGAVRGEDDLDSIRNLSVKGIFNPRAIQSLQGTPENKIAKPIVNAIHQVHIVLSKSEALLDEINSSLKNNGEVFQ